MANAPKRPVVKRRGNAWYFVTSHGLRPDGTRDQRWHSGYTTEAAAERDVDEYWAALGLGSTLDPTTVTVGEYVSNWLEGHETIRGSTYRDYRGVLTRHIIPAIGNVRLSRLTPDDVARLWRCVPSSKLHTARTVLGQALGQAERYGVLSRNVARLVKPGRKHAPKDVAVWSADELRAFLRVAQDDEQHAYFRVLLATGMRRGEVEGLLWSDVDGAWVTVRHNVSSARSQPGVRMVGDVKTRAGRRIIKLDPRTVAVLREQRSRVARWELRAWQWAALDLVFPRHDGRLLRQATMDAALRRLCAAADVPYIRMHGLRHTHATHALANGEPVHAVSQRLGHANVSITLDIYAHVLSSMQEQAAERIAGWLDETG